MPKTNYSRQPSDSEKERVLAALRKKVSQERTAGNTLKKIAEDIGIAPTRLSDTLNWGTMTWGLYHAYGKYLGIL